MNADHRLAALRRRFSAADVEAFLITDAANMRYITGFEHVLDETPNAACLVTAEWARFYTDGRYEQAALSEALGTPWAVHLTRRSLYVELCEQLAEEGVASLALEASNPYGRFRFISEQFHGHIHVFDQWIEEQRQVKEPREIERIEHAARLSDEAMLHAAGLVAPGMTERKLALELEFLMRAGGSEGVAFPVIVASGPNSTRPHAIVTDRAFEDGDLVVVDLGARVGGYCSDVTRTFVAGEASEEALHMYESVLAANEAAIARLKAGVRGSEMDAVARELLAERGLADRFAHGLGHGVGIDVHELPRLGASAHESVLDGSVVTVEPGVYVPGVGGVRIEDLVVVEDGGCRVLSHAPKELDWARRA